MERYIWGIASIFVVCCFTLLLVLQQFTEYRAEHYLGRNVQKVQQEVQGKTMTCRGISHQSVYTCQEQEGLFHQMVVMHYDPHRQIVATDHIVQIHMGEHRLGVSKNSQLDELGANYVLNMR